MKFPISSYKIEPLADHEWGYRATVRLMWHHRWVVLLLCVALILLSSILAIRLDDWIFYDLSLRFDIWQFSNRATLDDFVYLPIVAVGLTIFFLKSAGLESSWRVRALASLIFVFLVIVEYIGSLGFDIAFAMQDQLVGRVLVWAIALPIFVLYSTVCTCLCAQILVDGKINIRNAYRGVHRRWLRLWLTVGLLTALNLPLWWIDTLLAAGNQPASSVITYLFLAIKVILLIFQQWLGIADIALSTIWFLYPRDRTPKDAAISERPTETQPM